MRYCIQDITWDVSVTCQLRTPYDDDMNYYIWVKNIFWLTSHEQFSLYCYLRLHVMMTNSSCILTYFYLVFILSALVGSRRKSTSFGKKMFTHYKQVLYLWNTHINTSIKWVVKKTARSLIPFLRLSYYKYMFL